MVSQVGVIPAIPDVTEKASVSTLHDIGAGGTTRYVDSNGVGAGIAGLSANDAFATVDLAINSSSAGDTIRVLEGHAETITLATEFVPDVAGLKIIGEGRGARRPTITFDETTGNIPISGAGTVLENFLFTISGTKDVVAGITVSAADVLLKDIELREATITDQFVDAIVGTTCDRLHIDGLKFVGATASDQATQAAVSVTGTPTEITIENFNLLGSFTAAGIDISGVATELCIKNGRIEQRHTSMDAAVTVAGTATGFLIHVYVRTATDDATGMTAALTATNDLQIFDFRVVNANGETGVDGPTSDLDQTDNDGATGIWGQWSTLE